jgi:hypothetical protein
MRTSVGLAGSAKSEDAGSLAASQTMGIRVLQRHTDWLCGRGERCSGGWAA